MSSMGGQWRVLRHYLSLNNINTEVEKLLQKLRSTAPEQWEGILKRFERIIASRGGGEMQPSLPGRSGTVLSSSVETRAQVADKPERSMTDKPEHSVPNSARAVDAAAPPVDTNSLPSHLKDISWDGLIQGLRLKKDLHFGNIAQPSWSTKKPLLSKTSIECRTEYVVSAVGGAREAQCVRKRVEDLVQHLHAHPAATDHALRAGALRVLLRALRALPPPTDPHARDAAAAIREALSLVGWAGPPRGRCVRVLALDGGGVRGLAALALLRALENEAGCKIEEMFDLVVGVSTGAIIAAIIGSGVGDLETASRMYVTLSREMFGNTSLLGGASRLVWSHAYYDTEAWERMLREQFGDVTLTGCARGSRPRLALVSVARGAERRAAPFLFRSYRAAAVHPAHAATEAAPLWAAVRASAAAPTYFAEYRHAGVVHQDGGLLVNNPAGVALQEARRVWPRARPVLVSVGTGRAPPAHAPAAPAAAAASWRDKFNTILDSATDTEGVHQLLNDLLPADTYFRFNPPLTEPCAMDEIDPDKIQHMMDDTQAYIRRNQHKLSRAVRLLTARRSAAQRLGDALRERAIIAGLIAA